jgi:hypothetical protein
LLQAAHSEIQTSVTEGNDEIRQGLFSSAIETYIKGSTMLHFFETGRLLRMGAMPFATNDEYLGGVIGFAHELQVSGHLYGMPVLHPRGPPPQYTIACFACSKRSDPTRSDP